MTKDRVNNIGTATLSINLPEYKWKVEVLPAGDLTIYCVNNLNWYRRMWLRIFGFKVSKVKPGEY